MLKSISLYVREGATLWNAIGVLFMNVVYALPSLIQFVTCEMTFSSYVDNVDYNVRCDVVVFTTCNLVQLGPRYEGQLNHMAEPIPHPFRPLVRPHDTHHYPTVDERAETDIY